MRLQTIELKSLQKMCRNALEMLRNASYQCSTYYLYLPYLLFQHLKVSRIMAMFYSALYKHVLDMRL